LHLFSISAHNAQLKMDLQNLTRVPAQFQLTDSGSIPGGMPRCWRNGFYLYSKRFTAAAKNYNITVCWERWEM